MIKQENKNYVVSKDDNGRYEFHPVENFSHVLGTNLYWKDTTLYNDKHGNLIVEGKELNGITAGKYFPEKIIDKYTGWYEVLVEIDDAIAYLEKDDPINKSAIKQKLSKNVETDWKIYIMDFAIEKEYLYKFDWYGFTVYHEDNYTEFETVISDPYEVILNK